MTVTQKLIQTMTGNEDIMTALLSWTDRQMVLPCGSVCVCKVIVQLYISKLKAKALRDIIGNRTLDDAVKLRQLRLIR